MVWRIRHTIGISPYRKLYEACLPMQRSRMAAGELQQAEFSRPADRRAAVLTGAILNVDGGVMAGRN
jgi:hypothetical protein